MYRNGGRYAWVNGSVVPEESAVVSLFDHGFLYGDGIYDTMFARRGLIFRLDAHLARFRRSRMAIGLSIAFGEEELRGAVRETVRANRLHDAYIKIIATRGVGSEPLLDPRGCRPNVFIMVRRSLSQMPDAAVAKGLSVKVTGVSRLPETSLDPRVKSLNYLPSVLARMEAVRAGCDDGLLVDEQGNVCEATGSNIFIVRSSEVRSPVRSILEGITRQAVLDLCLAHSISSRGQPLTLDDLAAADEVFLTSTAGGIMPVTRVDGQPVGPGEPGPVSTRLRTLFDEQVEAGWGGAPID